MWKARSGKGEGGVGEKRGWRSRGGEKMMGVEGVVGGGGRDRGRHMTEIQGREFVCYRYGGGDVNTE